jgi:predicted phosphodiesterase
VLVLEDDDKITYSALNKLAKEKEIAIIVCGHTLKN